MENEITYQIQARLGILSTSPTGWTKEVNSVSWNGGVPKVDIRDWSPDHQHMSRGITLSHAEAQKLASYINEHLIRDRA